MTILEDEAIDLLLKNNPELIGKKIGLVFYNLPSNTMRPELCENISSRAGKYNLILFNTDYPTDSHHELKIIQEANETHDISGFIIWPSTDFDQYAGKYLQEQNIPFVLIAHVSDMYQGKFNEVCAAIDSTSLAINHFIEQGAKKIGFLIGDKTYNTVYIQQRYICYRNTLLENKLPVYEPICIPDLPETESFSAFDENIVNEVKKYDAVFATTDFLMALLYKRCVDGGIKIPDDLLFASIDNTLQSLCLDVTSIEQNFNKMAKSATDMLASLLVNPEQKARQLTVPSELIIRSSSIKKDPGNNN